MYTLSVLIFSIVSTLLLIGATYYADIFIDKLIKKILKEKA